MVSFKQNPNARFGLNNLNTRWLPREHGSWHIDYTPEVGIIRRVEFSLSLSAGEGKPRVFREHLALKVLTLPNSGQIPSRRDPIGYA